jgi:hypothetical protein
MVHIGSRTSFNRYRFIGWSQIHLDLVGSSPKYIQHTSKEIIDEVKTAGANNLDIISEQNIGFPAVCRVGRDLFHCSVGKLVSSHRHAERVTNLVRQKFIQLALKQLPWQWSLQFSP